MEYIIQYKCKSISGKKEVWKELKTAIELQIDFPTKMTPKMQSNTKMDWSRSKSGLSISTALDKITKKELDVAHKIPILA